MSAGAYFGPLNSLFFLHWSGALVSRPAMAAAAWYSICPQAPLAWFAWCLTEAALLAEMIDFWQMVLTHR